MQTPGPQPSHRPSSSTPSIGPPSTQQHQNLVVPPTSHAAVTSIGISNTTSTSQHTVSAVTSNVPANQHNHSSPASIPQVIPTSSPTATSATGAVASSAPAAATLPIRKHPRWANFKGRLLSLRYATKKVFQKQKSNQRYAPPPGSDWISGWLHPVSLLLFFMISIGFIVAITVLLVKSRFKQGIAAIRGNTPRDVVPGISVDRSLLWTFIPTLLVQIYSLCFKEIVAALRERQPYVELREARGDGVLADKSVLLDYAKDTELTTIFTAWKNSHFLIAAACMLSLILALIATPAASHILYVRDNVQVHRDSSLLQQVFYDENGILANTNLKATLDTITAIRQFNTSRPTWISEEFSFPPMNPASVDDTAGVNASLVVNATQLATSCRALTENSEWTIKTTNNGESWNVLANDGTCNISALYANNDRAGTYRYYAQTFAEDGCPPGEGSSPSRILLFFAQVDAKKNFISKALISCRSEYVNVTGRLNLTFSPTTTIQSFEPQATHITYPRPLFWRTFEDSITSITTPDNTARYSATSLGRLVLDSVLISPNSSTDPTNDSKPIDPSVLVKSFQQNIALAYAVASQTSLFRLAPDGTPTNNITAVYTFYNSRLATVDAVAYFLLAVFLITAAITFLILLHSLSHTSILKEEPRGILGSAILSYNSADILEVSDDLRKMCTDGKCISRYKEKPDPKNTADKKFKDWKWKAENVDSTTAMCIVAKRPP